MDAIKKSQRQESVALGEEVVEGWGEDGEHALVGFERVVEVDDGAGTEVALNLREHLFRGARRFVVAGEDVPIDETIALLMQGAALTESRFAIRRPE